MPQHVELWAGIECSYNRVGDRYGDQLARSGAYDRPSDVDRLAALGVRAVRFPVLWERVEAVGEAAWEWADDALSRLRTHGIEAIVGLMHHGSGVPDTSLLDPALPRRLATFARRVAERYPWVTRFTPINEPLTTARFAALYGLWYPHATAPQAFARAVVNQVVAVRAAMRAIREVIPDALLVQTEDLGKTHATGKLRYQAEFENERRWLTYDLLAGRVVGRHPMASYLSWAAVPHRELSALADDPCPPDVIGVNHYLTSERFLDHRLDRYPPEAHGGNHRDRYADVEAVRVLADGVAGPYALLREAWERYHTPIAVTEAHLACTREQQLRWLDEVWRAAVRLRTEGGDVRAVTAWSAFGAHDWASLLTRDDGVYEPGLFDARAPEPRPTALAAMVCALAAGGEFRHPAVEGPGWWQSDRRLQYPPAASPATMPRRRAALVSSRVCEAAPRLLIVGASGTLGRAAVSACEARQLEFQALSRAELDVCDERAVADAIVGTRPWAVVNCAGFVRVDDAERERAACAAANEHGAQTLAEQCARVGVRFITFSSDLVFDGRKRSPYVESDDVHPLCEYGRSKAAAEATVLGVNADALVVRTAAFFGDDDYNFVTLALRALASGRPFDAMCDVTVSPTYVPDLVDAVLDLLIDGERGVWHVANAGAVTWAELARRAARIAGVDARSLRAVPAAELGLPAPRPAYSALASERGTLLPPLDDALARYARTGTWSRPAPGGAQERDEPRRVAPATPPSTLTPGWEAGEVNEGEAVGAQDAD